MQKAPTATRGLHTSKGVWVAEPPQRAAQPRKNNGGGMVRAFREHVPPPTTCAARDSNPGPADAVSPGG
ncbi:hypothetical protein GCM10010431_71080 [Streptomyces kunmingensis]